MREALSFTSVKGQSGLSLGPTNLIFSITIVEPRGGGDLEQKIHLANNLQTENRTPSVNTLQYGAIMRAPVL